MTAQRAMQGSPVLNAAQNNLASTLRGDYLRHDANPYLQGQFDAGARNITRAYQLATAPQTDAAFSRAGVLGGSAHQEIMGENQRQLAGLLGDLANNVWGQNYRDERGNQQRAAFAAPQIAQADYQDAQALLGVGDIRRENQQDALNLVYEEIMRQQAYPQQQLDVFGNALRTAAGGQSQSSQTAPNPYRPSRSAGALGGAAAGGALGSALAGASAGSVAPGWGTAIGALLGAGYGAFA